MLSPILSAGAELVGSGIGFSPSGETGEGFVWDLTQMMAIDRHVGLPLSKWRGHGVDLFSAAMRFYNNDN